jgi:nicotinate-nucleotide--dimethylbenzimidazole phosphoribosyltransferase
VDRVTGRGTGIDDEGLRRKVAAIETALSVNDPDKDDPLDVLAKVGGFEIGGIAGVILGAAARKKPVLIDGFISTAGAIVASRLAPLVLDYLIASHRSLEPGHRIALESLGKIPLSTWICAWGRNGRGPAMPLVDAAAAILTEVATFTEAGVTRAEP